MTDHLVTHPVARKPHRCSECGRQIPSGEAYRRQVTLGDGPPTATTECLHCEAAWDWLWRHRSELRYYCDDNVTGNLGIYLAEEDGVPPRIQAGYRLRWTVNGKVLPVDHCVFGLVSPGAVLP